jgi:hypothetical protein
MPASFEDTYVIGRCTVSSAAITGGRECGEMLPVGRSCEICPSRRVGIPIRPPLPVTGAFDGVGVDVIHFVRSNSGNQYAVVFADYLTKWVEVFATKTKLH